MDFTKSGGVAWILGSGMMLVTMSLHPTGHDLATREVLAHGAFLARSTHALALLSLPLHFLGALALTRHLGGASSLIGSIVFGQGLVAVMLAAIASGFIAPELFAARLANEGPASDGFGLLLHYNFRLNQACAQVHVCAASIAIGIWSARILRGGKMARAIGLGGLLLALVPPLALLTGHLRLDVHGFGAVVLGQAVWMIAVGASLYRVARLLPTHPRRDG